MTQQRTLTVHFNDGSRMTVRFPQQVVDPAQLASRLQKALDSRHLSLEVDGQLLVIPMGSVKYLQAAPAPEKLPDSVIRGASVTG